MVEVKDRSEGCYIQRWCIEGKAHQGDWFRKLRYNEGGNDCVGNRKDRSRS